MVSFSHLDEAVQCFPVCFQEGLLDVFQIYTTPGHHHTSQRFLIRPKSLHGPVQLLGKVHAAALGTLNCKGRKTNKTSKLYSSRVDPGNRIGGKGATTSV